MNSPRFFLSKSRDEKKSRLKGKPYDFQIKTHENAESVAKRINALYQDAKAQDPEVFTENIEIDAKQAVFCRQSLAGD